MNQENNRRVLELMDAREKLWWQSKKFWVWAISFALLCLLILYSIAVGADSSAITALVQVAGMLSLAYMLGQAGIDALVRFAKVYRGMAPYAFGDPAQYEHPDPPDPQVWAEAPKEVGSEPAPFSLSPAERRRHGLGDGASG